MINETLSMSQIIDGISEGLCVCHKCEEYPYIKFTVWNQRMVEITGYTIEEINEKGWVQVLSPTATDEQKQKVNNLIHMIKKGEHRIEEEWNIMRKNGEERYIILSTSLVTNKDDIEHILVLVRDITKQKHMEEELKEINYRFATLFEVSPDAVFMHDGEKIIFANSAAVKLLGAEKVSDLIQSDFFRFVHTYYHELVKRRIVQVKEEKEALSCIQEKFIKLNGDIIDVEVSGVPIIYGGNRYSLIFVRDITERVKTELELRKSRKKFRDLFNNISDSIFIYRILEGNKCSTFIEANNAACNRYGYTREELYKLTPFDIDSVKDLDTVNRITNEINEKGRTIFQTVHVTKFGESIPVEISSMPFDMDGERVILSIARDITERIKQEKSLRESEERHRSLIEMLPYAVFIRNDEKLLYANKLGLGFLGTDDEEEVVNRSISEFLVPHPDYESKSNENMRFISTNGYLPLSEEKYIRQKDNKILDFETVAQKFNYKGEDAVIFVVNDISKRKENEELQRKMEEKTKLLNQAKEYEKLRTEFFANISHELRTPINVILSALQLCNLKVDSVGSGEGIDKLKRYIAIMKQNCYRLIRLINNLIDVTKIDSGYIHMNLNNYNIVSIVEEITLSVAEYIENKGISLIFDTDVEEKIIACDPEKIERIVLNLISNAVKFTAPGGEILVTMSDKGSSISISVKDTGIGIPKEKQKYIFERFIQVDKSLTRAREGSGIGLSLVKSMVELHKGNIKVNSKYGRGSEFIVELPVTLLDNNKVVNNKNRRNIQGNIEKISVEFSDIYF